MATEKQPDEPDITWAMPTQSSAEACDQVPVWLSQQPAGLGQLFGGAIRSSSALLGRSAPQQSMSFAAAAPSAYGGTALKEKKKEQGAPARRMGNCLPRQPPGGPPAVGSATGPGTLLKLSGFMQAGPDVSPVLASLGLSAGGAGISSSAARCLTALKHLAEGLTPKGEQEDPLVAVLMGSPAGYLHWNFVCDGQCNQAIRGVRYKACNKVDFDVCPSCRCQGNFKEGEGFIGLADASTALRAALLALLEWWPIWALYATHRTSYPPPELPQAMLSLRIPSALERLGASELQAVVQRIAA